MQNDRYGLKFAAILLLVALAYALGMVIGHGYASHQLGSNVTVVAVPAISPCAEDVVLVGVGDFEAGYWTAYECGPALDDFGG